MIYVYNNINTHMIMMQRYINLHMFNTFHNTFFTLFFSCYFLFFEKQNKCSLLF